MQLHSARLCLDCQEVHAEPRCPVCTSESFAVLSRWIPAQERRARERLAAGSDAAEAYRRLLMVDKDTGKSSARWPRRMAFLVALGVGGWLWRRPTRAKRNSGGASPIEPLPMASEQERP